MINESAVTDRSKKHIRNNYSQKWFLLIDQDFNDFARHLDIQLKIFISLF